MTISAPNMRPLQLHIKAHIAPAILVNIPPKIVMPPVPIDSLCKVSVPIYNTHEQNAEIRFSGLRYAPCLLKHVRRKTLERGVRHNAG